MYRCSLSWCVEWVQVRLLKISKCSMAACSENALRFGLPHRRWRVTGAARGHVGERPG